MQTCPFCQVVGIGDVNFQRARQGLDGSLRVTLRVERLCLPGMRKRIERVDARCRFVVLGCACGVAQGQAYVPPREQRRQELRGNIHGARGFGQRSLQVPISLQRQCKNQRRPRIIGRGGFRPFQVLDGGIDRIQCQVQSRPFDQVARVAAIDVDRPCIGVDGALQVVLRDKRPTVPEVRRGVERLYPNSRSVVFGGRGGIAERQVNVGARYQGRQKLRCEFDGPSGLDQRRLQVAGELCRQRHSHQGARIFRRGRSRQLKGLACLLQIAGL